MPGLVFAVLAIAGAYVGARLSAAVAPAVLPAAFSVLKVVVTASAAGLLTRFIVVGGGFVVVAAFVLALGFPMSVAVGTSLLVIAINTSALLSRMSHGVHLDWLLIGVFTLAAIVGSLLGGRLATRARPQRLSVAFTMLLVAVAQYTAIRSFLSWCDVGALPDPIPHVPTETSQMLARSVTSLLERSRPPCVDSSPQHSQPTISAIGRSVSASRHGTTSDLHIQHTGFTAAGSSIGSTKHPISRRDNHEQAHRRPYSYRRSGNRRHRRRRDDPRLCHHL